MRSALCGMVLIAATLSCSDEELATPDGGTPDAGGRTTTGPIDLRFKEIGAYESYASEEIRNVGRTPGSGTISISKSGEFEFSPLQLDSSSPDSGNYDWRFFDFTPTVTVEPRNAIVQTGGADVRDDDLAMMIDQHMVITSLDLRPDAYAVAAVGLVGQTASYTSTGFVDLLRADLDAWVAAEGAAGRVVTALSSSSDRIHVLSYARSDETMTYETNVLDASASTFLSQATALASTGYFITAFGLIAPDAFVLVGTRPTGLAAARELYASEPDTYPIAALQTGYVPVCFVFDGTTNRFISQR